MKAEYQRGKIAREGNIGRAPREGRLTPSLEANVVYGELKGPGFGAGAEENGRDVVAVRSSEVGKRHGHFIPFR